MIPDAIPAAAGCRVRQRRGRRPLSIYFQEAFTLGQSLSHAGRGQRGFIISGPGGHIDRW